MAQPISISQQPKAVAYTGMEVHVRNVPQQSTEKILKNFFKNQCFNKLSIQNVHCKKGYQKPFATLTFLHAEDAEKFLLHHGQPPRNQRNRQNMPNQRVNLSGHLKFLGSPIYCEKSNKEANPYLLRVLGTEEKERKAKSTAAAVATAEPKASKFPITFETTSLQCGSWNYVNSNLVFEPQLEWSFQGKAKFGEHSIIAIGETGLRVDFRYFSINGITAEEGHTPAFIISVFETPRFYEKIESDVLLDLMAQLGLANKQRPAQNSSQDRHRLPAIDQDHQQIAGSCQVYRITLRNDIGGEVLTIGDRISSLQQATDFFRLIKMRILVCQPKLLFSAAFEALVWYISRPDFPFIVAFQVQKLAQGGFLSPMTVIQLLPEIQRMIRRTSLPNCVNAIRKLFKQISFAGPETEASEFDLQTIQDQLLLNQRQSEDEEKMSADLYGNSRNVASIHRAKITPGGIILSGPDEEANNRVLRKYLAQHEYFLRVQFCDEDGEPVRYNPRISNEKIYHQRFKEILDRGLKIAGRTYSFLGFSHSSLRAQSCWFMAPFLHSEILMIDKLVIEDLGNFEKIRSPAKCAARIGQSFSETRTAVTVDQKIVRRASDVENGPRCFSDGVGTMSLSVMEKIWDKLPKSKLVKPTLFQIRFQGAKGMISYDSRLRGDALVLRPSMVKFDGTTWPDIEICEAPYRPLPMYLNRQFIKILEDMGVDENFFLQLQAEEVKRLRSITESPINAANFMKRHTIGTGIHLPWLISELSSLDLDFRMDGFLRDAVEMTVLMDLRLLKHKTRIPVKEGWHLHGIMDEFGFLEEGQIYCSVLLEGRTTVIAGHNLIITRAPALHPGDVQVAKGVIPPEDHPLRNVSNCVVFSSKGDRDLPSQLSGGDLDGDRYYVMWDKNCKPTRYFTPANYPRLPALDIGRPVERSDITEHFIKFMETDQLGRIAVLHRVLADQMVEGTVHQDCITLAEMHSTAVDFSKTGIPYACLDDDGTFKCLFKGGLKAAMVDMTMAPRSNPWRPDFEAPGPHVKIEKSMGAEFEAPDLRDPDDRGDEDDDFSSYRYYESHKVLGKLYRAIDERAVFEQIKSRSKAFGTKGNSTVIDSVWEYVQKMCQGFEYTHLLDWARDIRDMYEETLLATTQSFSDHPSRPVTELECFIGNILGRSGAQSRRQRELSMSLKEKYDEDSLFVVNCILKEGTEWSDEALERSMACLRVSLEDRRAGGFGGAAGMGMGNTGLRREKCVSFRYIAAAVCLREVQHLPRL